MHEVPVPQGTFPGSIYLPATSPHYLSLADSIPAIWNLPLLNAIQDTTDHFDSQH
ncbi:MAG: hypothetical protein HYX66_02855 [Ignavibacteria bacterium]|nr:hypothetical protein [Ignavibacteria bacterium]